MAYGEFLMLAIILLTVVIMPMVVSAAWRLIGAVWLAIFQIYMYPVYDFYPSLAFLCSIGLWPELIKKGKELLQWRIMQYYILLLTVQVISLAWSPDVGKGIRLIVLAIPFAPILAATITVVEYRDRMILPLLYGVIVGAVIEAVLVICFRLVPPWEEWFISSSLVQIFLNPKSISIHEWSGVLMNPNLAACYLGITSLIAQAIAVRYRQFWMALVGLFLAAGVISTGSKAGILLLFLTYSTGCAILVWPKLRRRARGSLILLIILCLVYSWQHLDMIAHFVGNAWTCRLKIWNFGLISFPEHPLRGLGFGGWEASYPDYARHIGICPGLPPHNTMIYLWSQSGLVAVILGVLFIMSVLLFIWKARVINKWREFIVCLTMAMIWYFVHQQGTNWSLFNERHLMPIVAMILGIVYAISKARPEERNEA